MNKLKIRLKISIVLLLVSIIIVDIINLIFIPKSLYLAGIFSPACTCAACTALYGKLEKEDYAIWGDPPLMIIFLIAVAIFFDLMVLVANLKFPLVLITN